MTPWRLTRAALREASIESSVLTTSVGGAAGHPTMPKGTLLVEADRDRLAACTWDVLDLVRVDPGDLAEAEAGTRLAHAVVGDGVRVGQVSGGQWALQSVRRGVLAVNIPALASTNGHEDLSVYTLFDGQVVDRDEVVGRAKVIPFVVSGDVVAAVEAITRNQGPLVSVHGFVARRVAAVVLEGLGVGARQRFSEAFGEKVRWFGGSLRGVEYPDADPGAVREALRRAQAVSEIIVVAGARAKDPLDPAFVALDDLGAARVRRGMPAHPGSLCWIERLGSHWVVGVPSCGVLAQATIFDLVLTWLFADMPLTPERLASVGHGGLLTRDMAYRFPPYQAARERGEVE